MIRRTLSIPVFVVSVLGLAACASGFHFVRQWQLSRLSQTLLVQARTEEGKEHWGKAATHLDRYLRIHPHNQAVRSQLAVTFAKAASTSEEKQRAVTLYYRALASELGEQEDELRVGLANLLLETNRLLEAENEAQAVLDRKPAHPKASRVFALARYFQWRGGALASKRPAELKILQTVEDALAKNPGDIALVEIAATIYRDFPETVTVHRSGLNQLSRERIADQFLDDLVNLKPRDGKAFLSRHVYRTTYGLEGSEQDLEKALELAPEDRQILLIGSAAHLRLAQAARAQSDASAQQHLDVAAQLCQRLIDKKLAPDNPEPQIRLGDVRVLQGKFDEALQTWRDSLSAFSQPTDKIALHARIADHLLRSGRIDESKSSLDAIDELLATLGGAIGRQHHLVLMQAQGLRRAEYFLYNGRHSECVGEAQQAIARQPQLQPNPQTSHRAWDLLARGFAGLEDWTEAATAFDRAANFQPSAVMSRLAAARCWQRAGRPDLAVDRAEQVILVEGLPEAWLILGTAELQIQATTPPLDRSWTRFEAALAGLDKIDPSQLQAPWRVDFLRADYIALRTPTQSEPAYGAAAAAEVLRLAEGKYEVGSQFWFEACLAYERLGRPEDAERAWLRLNQIPGARTDAAIAASRRAAMHEDFAKANQILEEAGRAVPASAKGRLRQELIRVAQAKQDLPQMRLLLKAELQERPRDVGVLCRLAELDLRDGDLAALQAWEGKLKAAGQLGGLWARYFRVMRLLTSAKDAKDPALQEALAEQSQLATLRPNWAQSYALRGAIEQRMERIEAAAAAYEQAVALGERRYAVFEQLIACLDKLNRVADVEKYLARLESYLPTSQRLTEIASNRQLDSDRPERAVEIARRAVEQRPTDLRAKLWLGRLLLLTNRLGEARSVFEQATQDSPEDVRSWNGLFTYYLRSGERGRAVEVLESIRKSAKLDPVELDLVLGQAYLRLGESEEAMRLFAALSEQAPNRADVHLQLARLYLESDRERAKEHLEKAVALDPKLSQARWLLAAILAAGGSEAELAQAEHLLSGNAASGATATIEDRRVRALLLAQHGDAEGLGRAVRILEQIIAEGADVTNDRLLLAQFYERQAAATPDPEEAANMLKASRDQLVTVASRSRAQTTDVAVLVGFLLRQDEKTEAAVWLDRLEERVRTQSRDDVRAIFHLIDLRIKHGTFDQCEPWIARLEAIDHDPIRPLAARVKYLAAQGKVVEIEPLVEARAQTALAATTDAFERARIARAIGDLYLATNLLAGAERWYRIVVREDREQFPALALTLMRQDRAREAIALCEAAVEHDSSSRPAVVLTSILLEAGGKPAHMELAEGMLTVALQKFPEDISLLYNLGMLRTLADRYPEAIDLLRKVVTLNPRHVAALNNLAVLVAETPDQRDQAMQLVDQAIELRGQQSTLLDTKGTIFVFGGKSSEAITLLEAAARGPKSDPRHKFHLAIAYHDIGLADKAREQLETSLALKLEKHILTPTDRKLLDRLRTQLATTLR